MGFIELVEVGYAFPGGRTLFDKVWAGADAKGMRARTVTLKLELIRKRWKKGGEVR